MARFPIISKDGTTVRFNGAPTYNGTYSGVSYVEYPEVASPIPIDWEIGDYVDYGRTGYRYKLYSIPQPKKQAANGRYGGGFIYQDVRLYAATKCLEIAPFRDLVPLDNRIHFSSRKDFSVYDDVDGIRERIQTCMDEIYPGEWLIQLEMGLPGIDDAYREIIQTEKEFSAGQMSCLDALNKISDLWGQIGWVYDYQNGVNVIKIGYAETAVGKQGISLGYGRGLKSIKRIQTNSDEIATRLYVFGNERNIPNRYYNDMTIRDADSVDIPNLMLPINAVSSLGYGGWGRTDGLRDPAKAFIENSSAISKYGIIPKTVYFNGSDDLDDIYPSIRNVKIQDIWNTLSPSDDYYPSSSLYTGAEYVDEVVSAQNPNDKGVASDETGKRYNQEVSDSYDVFVNDEGTGPVTILIGTCELSTGASSSTIECSFDSNNFIVATGAGTARLRIECLGSNSSTVYSRDYELVDAYTYPRVKFGVTSVVTQVKASVVLDVEGSYYYTVISRGDMYVTQSIALDTTFFLYIRQVGFDINAQADLGSGKVIAFNTGNCAGRQFKIIRARPNSGGWMLICERAQDESLSTLFPNTDYPISAGDKFVLLDIAMPSLYVEIGERRLLDAGLALLEKRSKVQPFYEIEVDSKYVFSHPLLLEGRHIHIEEDGITEYGEDSLPIATLTIKENESNIPTYTVGLREPKKK